MQRGDSKSRPWATLPPFYGLGILGGMNGGLKDSTAQGNGMGTGGGTGRVVESPETLSVAVVDMVRPVSTTAIHQFR